MLKLVPALALAAALAGPTAVFADEPPIVRVTDDDCRRVVRHVPAADVAYEPGVDVRGNSVVPADLSPRADLALPERYAFELEYQPFRDRPLDDDVSDENDQRGTDKPELDLSTFVVGLIELDLEGHVTFNGQPLHDEDALALVRLCRAARGQFPKDE